MDHLFCTKCGAHLNPNDTICTACGTPWSEKTASTDTLARTTAAPEKKSSSGKIVLSIGGMISGIASIILGIYIGCMYFYGYEASRSYGGDAYTGIQNAAAQTANNVCDLIELVQIGFTSTLIVFGLFMFFYFALQIRRK